MIPVTFLSSYLYCPRKLFLQQVKKVSEPPKEAMIKGTIRHQTYDHINKIEESIVCSFQKLDDLSNMQSKYRVEYSKILRQVILANKFNLCKVSLPMIDAYKQTWHWFYNEANSRAENIHQFIEDNHVFGKELWENLIPKLKSEIKLSSESLQLRGVIDRVEVYPDKLIPLELKTGKAPEKGMWPGHKIQLAAYLMLLSEKHNLEINTGAILYLDIKDKRELRLNPFIKEEVLTTTKKVHELLKSANLPELCTNENKCNTCGLADFCYKNG